MRILLIGASGFVGGALLAPLGRHHEVVGTRATRAAPGLVPLDLRDDRALAALAADGFDLIVHAAGVVDLAGAERDPAGAHEVNVEPMRVLVAAAPAATRIVLFSSDNVFDGRRARYTEADTPAPVNAYGRTKVAAERVLLAEPRHLVVRIPIAYGRSRWADRFVHRFRNAATPARTDLVCAPVYLPALAADLPRLWHHRGLLHYGGAQVMTRYELMSGVRDALGLPTRVVPVTGADADRVPRPARLVLRSARHGLAGPDLVTALRHLGRAAHGGNLACRFP